MLILSHTDFSRCSIEQELFLVSICIDIEDDTLRKALQKLTLKLSKTEWFLHPCRMSIQVFLKNGTGKLWKNPVAIILESPDTPVDHAEIPKLSHEIFYGIKLPG